MRTAVLSVLILMSFQFSAFAQFSISGEFRPRTEYNHGLNKLAGPNQDAVIWTAQRTRLNFDFSNDLISSRISLQDVRTWGSTPQLAAADGFIALHEAWVQLKLQKHWKLKAGRQELVYDDQRMFGNVNWAQQARSHDILVLKYERQAFLKADLGVAYNQNETLKNPYATAGYKAMQYLWLHKEFGKHLGISLLFLNNGKQMITVIDSITNSYSTIYSQTAGTRMTFKTPEKITINAALYYQTGIDAANQELSAYYAATDVTLALLAENNLKFTAGFELLSGSDQKNPTPENNSFNPFYGTNHKFNGYMDYFYVGNHTGSVGLQDLYFKLGYKSGKFTPGLDFHLFSAAAQVYDASVSKEYNAALGNEIDLSIGYKLNDIVLFKFGYSQLFATESMEYLRSAKSGSKDEINNWAFLMLSVKPSFFESNKN